MGRSIVSGEARGPVLALEEGLSFWGGVDPASGTVIDAHHPSHGAALAGAIVLMPTSRGSCTGSGVLLELIQNGQAPAALVFREAEDVLTLGAIVAQQLFDRVLPVIQLEAEAYAELAAADRAEISATAIRAPGFSTALVPVEASAAELSDADRAVLDGAKGPAAAAAMRIIAKMAALQGAEDLVSVSQVHIDGCIYASPANLRFAEALVALGARVTVPTTLNAISVDYDHWREQGVPPSFGGPASRLADAYVEMGARPSFTCAPYLLQSAPKRGEIIAWAESNAVIYANSVLGARTEKHPDFFDLCIALTGRAPRAGVYLDERRAARRIINMTPPAEPDDTLWPLLGYLAGELAPDRIPLITGLEDVAATEDDLKALCAAFGTTSAAPMLHVAGHTPEADLIADGADGVSASAADLGRLWTQLNHGPEAVDLVALGSPHSSLSDCKAFAAAMGGRAKAPGVEVIITLGRDTLAAARADGVAAELQAAGVQIIPDLCWCSISEPLFPPATKVVMTNSGKYAHYGPGLSKRAVRFGSIAACADAAQTGRAPKTPPAWM